MPSPAIGGQAFHLPRDKQRDGDVMARILRNPDNNRNPRQPAASSDAASVSAASIPHPLEGRSRAPPKRITKAGNEADLRNYQKHNIDMESEDHSTVSEDPTVASDVDDAPRDVPVTIATMEEDEEEAALIPEEVTYMVLTRTIKRDITKTRRYRVFPCYLMFVLFFSLLLGLEHLSTDDRFHMTEALRDLLLFEDFEQLQTSEAWSSWLDKMVDAVWQQRDLSQAATPLDRNIPLGFILIRQWRIKPEYCVDSPQINILSAVSKARLPVLCYGGYGGDLDTSPYGPELVFKTTSDISYSVDSISVDGQLNNYNSLSSAFPVYLYLNSTLGEIKQQLSLLKTARYVDSATRAIVIDLFFFNPNIERFQLYHMLTEVDPTGDMVNSGKSGVFRVLKFDESHLINFLFCLDLVIFFFTLGLLVDLWLTVKNHYLLSTKVYESVNFWEVYMLGTIVLLLIRSVLRFWMWARGNEMGDTYIASNADSYGGDEDRLMFQAACDYLSKQRLVLILDAWIAILVWLRIFEYLQFNERLNLVTETIVNSLGQLVAMFVIFSVIVIGFSIAGRIFYGHAMYEFRSFTATLGYLIRLVLSADLGDYLDLEKIRPIMTPIYIASFFCLTWLVLLNMVLAIIAGSFQALQENALKQKTWSPQELWADLKKASQRFLPYYFQNLLHKRKQRKLQKGGKGKNGVPVLGEGAPKMEPLEDRVQVRLKLLPLLRGLEKEEQKRSSDQVVFITKHDFTDACEGIMSHATAEKVYHRAANDISGAQEKSFKLGERFAFHLNKRLRSIEGRIRGQQPNIDRIPEIEKESVRKHIINLQPKVDRLTELQEDIRNELFNLHHNLPTHFQEVHQDLATQMANLEKMTSERVTPHLQELSNSVHHPLLQR